MNLHENSELINSLIVAGIGLAGVILGIVTTSVITWKLKSKESRLRILEKIFDKRLEAHEEFLSIPKLMRTTISNQEVDDKSYFITYPFVLDSLENFEDFSYKFYEATYNSHWFESDLRKEIFFAQDYFQNVTKELKEIPKAHCHEFAKIVKQDFKDIAENLEEKVLEFLLIDIHKININSKNKEFRYSQTIIRKRLDRTELFIKWNEIQDLK